MLSEEVTQEQIDITFDGIGRANSVHSSEAAAATSVITLAFSADPVARWMYPDSQQYLRHFPEFVRAFAGRSFETRAAYIAKDGGGAALWMPPGIEAQEDPLIQLFWSSTSDEVQKDLFPIFDQMAEFHPKYPHWYLPMIGVEPSRQGSGIGSALLQHTLANCDGDGLPAYLESSNPKNIPLYERFGFELIGTIRSGDAPPLFPMLRQPQRAWDEDIFKTNT